MKLPRTIIISSIGIAVTTLGLWIYFKEFYYNPGPFSIGIRNGTPDTTLRDVKYQLEPRGIGNLGIEDPGQAKWDMDPHWPVPTRVSVSFTDPAGNAHTLSTAGAPPQFRGGICVVITKPNDYALHLELERR
ncbi:MAG: hypothetical protein ACXWDN_10310 [Limisphaerales bacterium]